MQAEVYVVDGRRRHKVKASVQLRYRLIQLPVVLFDLGDFRNRQLLDLAGCCAVVATE